MWQLAGGFMSWQAAMALKAVPAAMLPAPLQTACTLELGLCCRLQQPTPQVGGKGCCSCGDNHRFHVWKMYSMLKTNTEEDPPVPLAKRRAVLCC